MFFDRHDALRRRTRCLAFFPGRFFRGGRVAGSAPVLHVRPKPAQGPVIQEQKDKRQGDQHGLGHESQREKTENGQVPPVPRAFDVEDVRPHGEQPEQGGQDILPFGHPGHGLHVEGMQREERRHESARPEGLGHAAEDEKKEEGVGDVKKNVHQVMPPRIQSQKLDIQHVGKPRHGMPIGRMAGGQCPFQAFHRKSRLDMGVFGYVQVIIVIDELMGSHLPEDGQGHNGQDDADRQGPAVLAEAAPDKLGFVFEMIFHVLPGNFAGNG